LKKKKKILFHYIVGRYISTFLFFLVLMVTVSWLDGTETQFSDCTRLSDIRFRIASYAQKPVIDVSILNEEFQILEEETTCPDRVRAIITCNEHDDKEWAACLRIHAERQDVDGLQRCLELIEEELPESSVVKDAWFEATSCPNSLRTFLDAGVPVGLRGEYDDISLHFVALKGNSEIAQILIDAGEDVDAVDDYGNTPLHLASFKQCKGVISLLLAAKADPGKLDEDGLSSMHWAARTAKEGDDSIVKILLGTGACPNHQSRRGITPLHWACSNGNLQVVKRLIEAGANPNTQTKSGNSPLHWALGVCKKPNQEIVDILLENGADVKVRNKNGNTAEGLMRGESVGRWRGWTMLEGLKTIVRSGMISPEETNGTRDTSENTEASDVDMENQSVYDTIAQGSLDL